jgi:phosphoribosylcarboxyaminoimidazole (NCAIR) mutase
VAGAMNAAYFAASILAGEDPVLRAALNGFREKQTAEAGATQLPGQVGALGSDK